MWVFGYGSLMWDHWEQQFDGKRVEGAVLEGYRRAFNKKSVENWGSEDHPCPTLGLETDENATCTGVAFEFPEMRSQEVREYLRDREGPSFDFAKATVRIPNGRNVEAYVAINDPSADSYIGAKSTEEIAAMVDAARGEEGSCRSYLKNTYAKLSALGIEVDAVTTLWEAVENP